MLGIGFTSNIRYNLKQYYEKIFLEQAFYTNIKRGYQFYDGSNPAALTRVAGHYESTANEWAYETDISVPSGHEGIIAVSGAWVNNVFHANESAPYYPSPDYLRGRMVFRAAPPAGATVEAEFSAKDVKLDFTDSQVNNILMTKYLHNPDFWSSTSTAAPSGTDRIFPVVIVEPNTRGHTPKQLGGGKIVTERVSFFVYAARDYERDVIVDAIFGQARNVIAAVDYQDVPPILDYDGDYAATYQNYTQLQASTPWTKIYIDDIRVADRNLFVNIYQARLDLLLRIYLNS